MPGFAGWVDARIRAAVDHVLAQVGDPNSPAAKAVTTIADKVGDRVDESVAKLPEAVDRMGDEVRKDIRATMLNLVPDAATIARQVVDALHSLLPFLPRGGAVQPPPTFTEREPGDTHG